MLQRHIDARIARRLHHRYGFWRTMIPILLV